MTLDDRIKRSREVLETERSEAERIARDLYVRARSGEVIDPSVITDPEMAEDLIAAAFNDASNKIDVESQARMSAVTAGMPLPPGMKLPF